MLGMAVASCLQAVLQKTNNTLCQLDMDDVVHRLNADWLKEGTRERAIAQFKKRKIINGTFCMFEFLSWGMDG